MKLKMFGLFVKGNLRVLSLSEGTIKVHQIVRPGEIRQVNVSFEKVGSFDEREKGLWTFVYSDLSRSAYDVYQVPMLVQMESPDFYDSEVLSGAGYFAKVSYVEVET